MGWQKILDIMCRFVIPFVTKTWTFCSVWYEKLPVEIAWCLYGGAMCFFGGHYVVAIAAIEAFKMSGGETIRACFSDLCEEYRYLADKNKEDDAEDLDGDGIRDVL